MICLVIEERVFYMWVTVKDVCDFPSLKEAELISGKNELSNIVRGAMVMEALDIEDWGKPGQLLLTSYFAFKDATKDSLDLFFSKAKNIGIAGFIFKKDRLVHEIPVDFVEKCSENHLPLIQVKREIGYDKIIDEILETIINRDAALLKSYYNNQQKFIQLMMSQASSHQILETLKTLIGVPVSLYEQNSKDIIGTDKKYNDFDIDDSDEVIEKHSMTITFLEQWVIYHYLEKKTKYKVLRVPVPNLGYEEYELLVHVEDKSINDHDLMAIANTVVALQTELVKEYALKQNSHSRLNEMASDLVHNRLANKEDIEETIHYLELDPKKLYRVLVFNFENKEKQPPVSVYSRFTDSLVNHFKTRFIDTVYITRKQKVIFIVSTEKLSLKEIKKKIEGLLNALLLNKDYEKYKVQVTISHNVTVYDLADGYTQAINTQKIMSLLEDSPRILSYQDTGLYQLFLETKTLDSLEHFIPFSIRDLSENKPELLETLFIFINKNQNYSETAESLFVHPKTVRYRINQLKEKYDIDFHNPEEMLRYSIAIRIMKVIQKQM